MAAISVVIITYNEAENIGRCIDSVAAIADEILILDSGSTDTTCEIAAAKNAKIIACQWQGYAKTKNYGNSLAAHDWILSLDADEALSKELQIALLRLKNQLDSSACYQFNRRTYYGNYRVRYCGWYPDAKVRLFHRTAAHWEGEFVHETLKLKDNTVVIKLKLDILHYSFSSPFDHAHRQVKYAHLAAQKMIAAGKTKYLIIKMLFSPVLRFFKMYFWQKGFLDGRIGLIICLISAMDAFLRYAGAWFLLHYKK